MTSPARILASRANGKLSHGPKTPEGRRRSSQNARRHGLLSPEIEPGTEWAWYFEDTRRRLLEDWNPRNEPERAVVETIAFCETRALQTRHTEKKLIQTQIEALRARTPGFAEYDPRVQTYRAMAEIAQSGNTLDVLQRYRTQFEFRAHRARQQLLRLGKFDFRETNPTSEECKSAKRTQIAKQTQVAA